MRLLLHKGLDDGAERLRAQLRDTAQQGRRDEYGGDDIEDTAVSGSKRAAAELLKQRKEKVTEQPSDPARNGASAPDAHRNESSIIRTKDTEFAETQTPAATPQAQARRAAMQKAAAVKTKGTYIETQVKTSVTEAPEPQRQGQQAFVREQGRKTMRQARLRQTEQNRRLRNTSPGLGTSETIGTAQNAENPHDELDMDNAGNAAMIANWRDVLAIYAVRTTTDDTSPDEVATLTAEKLDILRQIFWDMNAISYWVETISGDEDESDTVILHITVTVKDHLQMADEYRFNVEQRKLLGELMQPEYQELFMALTGSYQDIDLSPEEIQEIINKLPTDLSEERKQVVLTAYQLLGKVNYFWGGKSLVLGWDSRWGTPMEVTAAGSSSSGTVRPFGLDCSGFVDWVFYNQSGGQYIIGHGGGASAQHSYCTPISWNDAKPGDLVFYPGDSHVGIVCGFDSSGNILIIHCASSSDNVVVTGKIGFTMIGRPRYFTE